MGHFAAYAAVRMGGRPPRPLESAWADPGRSRNHRPYLDYGSAFCSVPSGHRMGVRQKLSVEAGPYAFSRHPMYFSELMLMFGWAIFYGSIAVLIAFLIACAVFNLVNVPLEERALEAHFGESYLEYKNKVPRWFGKARR